MKEKFEIEKIWARELISDRWHPTLEVEILTKGGVRGRGASPSGTKPLEDEAVYLRDGGRRYHGMGVLNAARNVNEIIAPKLVGMDVTRQSQIDETLIDLDGTENKSRLGANATLSVSLAATDAASKALEMPVYRYIGGVDANILPVPWIHAVELPDYLGRRKTLPFQEHHVVPIGADSFSEALRMSVEVHHEAEELLEREYGREVTFGERKYFPAIHDEREALDLMLEAIAESGYTNIFVIALDCAASHFYDRERKRYRISGKEMTREELIDFYDDLVKTYPIFALEDPLFKDDFKGHAILTKKLGIQIVGDDLFVTNKKRIKKGIEMSSANSLLLKPNQIGTISEAIEVACYAQRNGCSLVVSGRQGIDEEDLIPDISVALNAEQTKIGPLPTRRAKYNRLLRIEEELGDFAKYAGKECDLFAHAIRA